MRSHDRTDGTATEGPGRRLATLLGSSMEALALGRPLFHSEADFQLALAWGIQQLEPTAQIRLERRILTDPVVALDLLVALDAATYAVELKYLKAPLDLEIDNEPFHLAAGAPDVERYDFLRDVVRLERVVSEGLADAGCTLVLTNSPGFWRPGSGRLTSFDEFRIHEGRVITGTLGWGPTAGPGTRSGREDPIELAGSFECRWHPYSTVDPGPGGELRYLALLVGGREGSP